MGRAQTTTVQPQRTGIILDLKKALSLKLDSNPATMAGKHKVAKPRQKASSSRQSKPQQPPLDLAQPQLEIPVRRLHAQRRGAYSVKAYNVRPDTHGRRPRLAYPHIEMLDLVVMHEPTEWLGASIEERERPIKEVARVPVEDLLCALPNGEEYTDMALLRRALAEQGVDLGCDALVARKRCNEGLEVDYELQSQFDLAGLMREVLAHSKTKDYCVRLSLREKWLGARYGQRGPRSREGELHREWDMTPHIILPVRCLTFH